MRWIPLLLLWLPLAAWPPAAAAAPADPAPSTPPEVRALLARLDAARPDAAGGCLRVPFERRKATPLLRRPLASSGVLTASGGALRWETRTPRPGLTVIAGGQVRIVDPGARQVEVYPLGGPAGAAASFGPASPLSGLPDRFAVTRAAPPAWDPPEATPPEADPPEADPPEAPSPVGVPAPALVGLRLVPLDAAVATQLRSIGLGVEEATGSVRLLETLEADGSSTAYRFGSAEPSEAPCPIEPPAPEGYELVRPLER